jgi:NADH-quinone oxidoreductase subunit J
MDLTVILFIGIALAIIGTGLGVLLSRNSIYAALFLVANFSLVALLYLVLGAPFIALSQVTVYAGAIMILFLFVIMLLGAERLPGGEPMKTQRWIAFPLVGVLLGQVVLLVVYAFSSQTPLPEAPPDFGGPVQVGTLLFTKYALPFEITSIILLVAVIGAIVLTRGDVTQIRSSLLRRDKKDKSS